MKKHKIYAYCLILLVLLISNHIFASNTKHKILYIDSYNANVWSATIENGIHFVLDERDDIELRIFRMDTKRFPLEQFKKTAALKAKEIIREWKPDVIIASDDNAAKYLIVPYLMNSDIPVVFCGINYDASKYGFPTKNITGIVEVMLIDETLDLIKQYTKGNKIGFIAADNLTAHSSYDYLVNEEKRVFSSVRFVKTFEELKKAFLEVQQEVDMLFFYDTFTVDDFNLDEMIKFAKRHTIVPTFGSLFLTIKHSLLGTPKIGEELGEWAANKAIEILNGKKPSEIPIAKNQKSKIFLNLPMANKLGIKFPIELIDNSFLIYDKDKKILLINLFRHKCEQNNDVEEGIITSLNLKQITETEFDNTESDVDFKYYKKNTHEINSLHAIDVISQQIIKEINLYKPNVIIAIDNNIIQYILNNYYSYIRIPFILCQQNTNVTLFNEKATYSVSPNIKAAADLVSIARSLANGNRIGYLSTDTNASKEYINSLKNILKLNFTTGYFVSSTNEAQEKFLKLQKEVDTICLFKICQLNVTGGSEFNNFFINKTTVPTIDFSVDRDNFALLGLKPLTFDQGIIAGKLAQDIIFNKTFFPVKNFDNLNPQIFINNSIAKRLGIIFPKNMLDNVIFIK